MSVWENIQNSKPNPKAQKAQERASKAAHKQRQENQKQYDKFNVEETNGFRSRLEALWVSELEICDSFSCVECVEVPVWIDGPYGRFLSSYKPDLVLEMSDGSTVFVELKPNHKLAMDDDRPKRALELNPKYRFVIIGGYPYSQRGVTVRMLTGKKEVVHKHVQVRDVLKFLECDCE